MRIQTTVNESATDRLKHLVRAELTRRGLSEAGAAREARLPGSVFQSLLRLGKRPTLDRADQIAKALRISLRIPIKIGVDEPRGDVQRGKSATDA